MMVSDVDRVNCLLDSVRLVDVDSHILEPPDLWTSRVSPRWKEEVPHLVSDPSSGAERWIVGKNQVCGAATHAPAEWKEFYPSRPDRFDQAVRSAWDPAARLQWMDRNGVYAQVVYPNLLGFYMWAFLRLDEDLRLECVRAYNDFQCEFCSNSLRRLIPVAYLPFWDVDASVTELLRCREMGFSSLNLGFDFERIDLPPLRSKHWDRLLATAQDLDVAVNFHVGFSTQTEEDVAASTSLLDTLDVAKSSALFLTGNMATIAELIMGQVCHRFPTLRFVSVESGFGYIPYLLEALDWQFTNGAGAARTNPSLLLPSEYFRRQIYATFWFEQSISRVVDLYPDNIMFETDFPHPTSLSPGPNTYAKGARDTIVENLSSLPDSLLQKILQGNATRVYALSFE